MTNRKKKGMGIADYVISNRKTKATFLDGIEVLVDWRPIQTFLNKKLRRKANAVGNPAYPALPMFKVLLLQRWYNLSDPGVEEALLDRLSFLRFAGFSLEGDIPDETTICRFRNGLITLNILETLLDMINQQLERQGLLVREGVVVDASVVESQRRPRKVIDVMPEDRAEDSPENGENAIADDAGDSNAAVKVSYSDDTEAAWLRKGKRAHYGFKIHMATDGKDGFVLCGHVTPANHSDTREFERLVDSASPSPGSCVFADKGYSSGANRDVLADRGLEDRTMDKKPRGGRLTEFEKARNRAISSVRYLVERTFGTLKRGYAFWRSRYVGMKKVEAEFRLVAMAFNLKKAVRLVSV